MGPARRPGPALVRWHRRVGLAAAALLVLLALTGVALNHSHALRLAQRPIGAAWLQHWWGVPPPRLVATWPLDGHWLSQWDGQLFIDDRRVQDLALDALVGVAGSPGLWWVVDRRQVLLLLPDGRLVETLGLPGQASARAAGQAPAGAWVATDDGRYWQVDAEGRFSALGGPASPSAANPVLPATLQARIATQPRPDGLHLERVLLDLHSGRWLGTWGPWVMDAAALGLLWLTLSGVWRTSQRRGGTR